MDVVFFTPFYNIDSFRRNRRGTNDFSEALVVTRNGVVGNIYVDWLLPDSYRSWSDSRIFCYGTGGFAELRLTAPISGEMPSLIIYGKEWDKPLIITENKPAGNIAEDMFNRIYKTGKKIILNPDAILISSQVCLSLENAIL